jgi:hypothetical protein
MSKCPFQRPNRIGLRLNSFLILLSAFLLASAHEGA